MEKKRVNWIDDARGLSVFCFLLADCDIEHHFLYTLYTPFFLTLFFFISGFLYKNVSIKEDLIKIIKHLVIPYFILNAIIILIGVDNWKAIISGDYIYVINKICEVLKGYSMWFIPCIIVVQIYATLLNYISKNSLVVKVFIVLLSWLSIYFIRNEYNYFLPWYMDVAFISLGFFLLGNIVKTSCGYKNWLTFKGCNYVALLLLGSYVIVALAMQNIFDMEFHYAYNYYKNPLLFVILSCLGIYCICVCFQSYHSRFFNYLGKNSLAFFAFNGKSKAIAVLLIPSLSNFDNNLKAVVLCLMESVILMIVSYLINRYCPFIIGKYKK